MLKIGRRTRLSNAAGVYFIRHLSRAEAIRLHNDGVIAPDETCGAEVISFRLTETPAIISVQVGSFGIHRTHVPVNQQYGLSGGVVFSHKPTYDSLRAA
jgi:hypothetical protein